MTIELNLEEKEFIKKNKNLLMRNDLDSFFTLLANEAFGLGNIAAYLVETGFPIWQHLSEVKPKMFAYSTIENIVIPEGITKIGRDAFIGCTELVDVKLPETLTRIDNGAFFDCPKIKQIYIPESVVSINKNAFANANIKLITPKRTKTNQLRIPKEEVDWYKRHLSFISESKEEEKEEE